MNFGEAERQGYLTKRALQLILLPTEQCNFCCPYCFEDFEHGRMKPAIVEGVKKLLDRRAPELSKLEVDWFGGEPLLAPDIVHDVQDHVRRLGARRPRIRLRSSMTTNGYLLGPDRLARLLDDGVSHYHIALDGTPEIHDARRCLRNGGATFDRIWTNLRSARRTSREFRITVRFQLDRTNRGSIDEFLELYGSTFGGDERFALTIVPLGCTDRSRTDKADYLDPVADRSVLRQALDRAEGLGLRPNSELVSRVCHASRGNSFVVRANGNLAKCAVALSDPRNQVGRLREDGRVEIDNLAASRWIRGLWSGDEDELTCPAVGITY